MALSNYYKKWHLQELVEVPSIFPPPWDTPTWEFGDGREVQGFFRQDQSTETLIAASSGVQTMGRFATSPNENLYHGAVLRSEELGVFLRLEGDKISSPEFATTQISTWMATVTSRTIEEQKALKDEGLM